MGALNTYLTDCRQMLHDPNGLMWPDPELTGYINQGRNRIANDSKCLRQLVQGVPLIAGVELYNIAATVALAPVPMVNPVIDVLGISLYWGNTRFKLNYDNFSRFDARVRAWQLYQSRPVLFTRMGALSIYVGPIPDQAYITDWDVAIQPLPLVTDADTDPIPPPWTEPVKYWACFLAKFKEQALGEAGIFKDEYMAQGRIAQRSFQTRVLTNPYAQ